MRSLRLGTHPAELDLTGAPVRVYEDGWALVAVKLPPDVVRRLDAEGAFVERAPDSSSRSTLTTEEVSDV